MTRFEIRSTVNEALLARLEVGDEAAALAAYAEALDVPFTIEADAGGRLTGLIGRFRVYARRAPGDAEAERDGPALAEAEAEAEEALRLAEAERDDAGALAPGLSPPRPPRRSEGGERR